MRTAPKRGERCCCGPGRGRLEREEAHGRPFDGIFTDPDFPRDCHRSCGDHSDCFLCRPDAEKLSAYECGFDAFDDARNKFDVRFYLVAILFIIFDLEVAFLFPWAVSLGDIGLFGFWSMVVFLGILTIGFIYEWKKGALEWE